jgi:hypothetical protein
MLYGIAKNSWELNRIPCHGMLLNSAEFRNVFVSAELLTISGNLNFFVFLNVNLSKVLICYRKSVIDLIVIFVEEELIFRVSPITNSGNA